MKNIKLLPLIALLGFVSGCSNAAKEPAFGTQGDVVSYSNFNPRFLNARRENEFFKNGILGDRTLKTTYIYTRNATVKGNNKDKGSYSSKATSVKEEQYDFASNVIKETVNTTEEVKSKTLEGKIQHNDSAKSEKYYQFGPVEGLEYLVEVNALYKTYYRIAETTESTVEEKHAMLDQRMRSTTINDAYNCFYSYYPSSDSTRNYLFYINNTIYTMTYHEETRQNSAEVSGTVTTDRKVQIDFAEGKEAVRFTETVKTELLYNISTGNYTAGDVLTTSEKTSYEYTIIQEDVQIDQLNLSKYSYVGD